MTLLVGVAVAAAILSAALTRLLRPLLVRYALARPNARSSHAVPTPQGGGIAVLAGTAAAATGGLALAGWGPPEHGLWVLALGAAALAALGGIDDIRPLSPGLRLAAQAACVGAVVWATPGRLLPALPAGLEAALLLVAGLWWVNLVNFMDGIDWLTVAEIVPLGAAVACLGLAGFASAPAAIVAAALAGGLLGFAPANRPVAQLFLGDVGSLPIGLLTGWLLLDLARHGGIAAAILLPLYYLADATLTLAARARRGERLTEAHRSHFYQRATAGGWGVIEVDRAVLLLNLGLAALAAATFVWPSPAIITGALLVGASLVAAVLRAFGRPR